MSDNARELLIYGVAAAKANSRDEARNYLERVLNTDADFEQQAEAWYWLSRIEEDPAQKRECLENVLAMMPRHPEARRDMAILDGRLKPEAMHDSRYAVAPIVPDSNADALAYKCPKCGARMTATGAAGGLRCGFCGFEPAGEGEAEQAGEQDWVAAIYAVQGHRWELPTERAFNCLSCGATVVMPPSNISANCLFCSTPYVAQSNPVEELIEPTGILPFAFDARGAWARIATWLQDRRFAPADLDERATQSLPSPVYIPFWTFDLEGEMRWRGWEASTSFGQPVRAPVSGAVPLLYDDVQVPATRSLSPELLSALKFDTSRMSPYSLDLLASWPTQIYSISVAEASLAAREYLRLSRSTTDLLDTSISVAGNVKEWSVESSQMSVLSYKLALVPVWVGGYVYKGTQYDVLVNGQSGAVEGNVPRNAVQGLLGELFGG